MSQDFRTKSVQKQWLLYRRKGCAATWQITQLTGATAKRLTPSLQRHRQLYSFSLNFSIKWKHWAMYVHACICYWVLFCGSLQVFVNSELKFQVLFTPSSNSFVLVFNRWDYPHITVFWNVYLVKRMKKKRLIWWSCRDLKSLQMSLYQNSYRGEK